MALKPPSSLVVGGTPVGAQVEIAGPGGFAVTKGLPVTVEGAVRGTYRVKVTREGYGAFEASAEVKGGERSVVKVVLVEGRKRVAEAAAATPAAAGKTTKWGPYDRAVERSEVKDPPEGSRNTTAYRDNGDGTVWDPALQLT